MFPLYCTTDLQIISLEFARNFAMITKWLDGQTDRWTYQQPHGLMDAQKYKHKDAIEASKNNAFRTDFAIFTKTLQTNRRDDGSTEGYDAKNISCAFKWPNFAEGFVFEALSRLEH